MEKSIKKVMRLLLMVFFVMTCCLQESSIMVQAATKADLKEKLQEATSMPIRKFIYEDLNLDGKKEAFAITSKDIGEWGYWEPEIWYLTSTKCVRLRSYDGWYIYQGSCKKYKVKNTWIVTFEVGAGGSGWSSYAYSFDRSGANEVDNIGISMYYLGKNKFVILDSQYDASTDGTGHTYNKYYSKWDGSKLVEYGGLKITQAQLKRAKNGSAILKQIKKKGNIGDIFYRGNGLIFVNYQSDGLNYNVALKLKNGKVSYYDQGGYGKSKMEKATQSGVIHKSITSCVKYPKSFPVK